jgi:hypothetical protein
VRPFALTMRGTFAYYFVCPQAAIARPEIQDFRAWLLDEVRAMDARAKAGPPAGNSAGKKPLKPPPKGRPRPPARAARRAASRRS